MQTIKILGTGCPNCKRTETVVRAVVAELKREANIIKVEDIQDIMEYNIMSTPAIVIDEKVVLKGHVPSVEEMKTLLTKDDCCNDTDTACCGSSDNDTTENCC